MAKWLEKFEVGDRVTFGEGFVADHPMSFTLPHGAMGTVVDKQDDPERDMRLEVKLDDRVDDLEHWDNVLHLTPVDLELNPEIDDQGPAGLSVTERPAPKGP